MVKKGDASADQVIQTYQGDSKVLEITNSWPTAAVERVALVAQAHRPAELILSLAWELLEMDKDEFRSKVYSVWSKTATDPIHIWTFGEMFNHIDVNPQWGSQTVDAKKWGAVQRLRPQMKANPPSTIGPLISFQDPTGRMLLDDGHTRLMAAYLENVFPSIIRLHLGKPPVLLTP
jgi:hypothetical protein